MIATPGQTSISVEKKNVVFTGYVTTVSAASLPLPEKFSEKCLT